MDQVAHAEIAEGERRDGDLRQLREFGKHRHVHFDLTPEVIWRGGERVPVGWELRLWARHDPGTHPLPGCSRCATLREELVDLAQWLGSVEREGCRFSVEPFAPALYACASAPDLDEVNVTLRLESQDGELHQHRVLQRVRARLSALRIPEQ